MVSPALEADYFTELASHVLGADAWGLIAAALGKSANKNTFVQRFWYGNEAGRPSRPTGQHSGSDTETDTDISPVGMLHIPKQAGLNPDSVESWETAVSRFNDASAEVHRLTSERQEVAEALKTAAQCEKRIHESDTRIHEQHGRCDHLRTVVEEAAQTSDQAAEIFRSIDNEHQSHARHKTGFWITLSTLFKAGRQWARRSEELGEHRRRAKAELEAAKDVLSEKKSSLAAAIAEQQRQEHARNNAAEELAGARNRIDEARAQCPDTVPFGPDITEEDQFQQCAPWAGEEFTSARSRLFLASLRLHKAFILNSEHRMRGNLHAVMGALRGKASMKPATLLAAWQSLFLVVPVISTTFASLPRLFAGLEHESLGWLFIDEAGQASTQQAAGGIWRSRRAVIVGDPQQLEPIVALPRSTQRALQKHFDVHEQWLPDTTSAQRVADRLARYGTTLPADDGESTIWVGAPLRVHRRCDRPMFDLSNNIAYGGTLMVYGTNHSQDFPGENCWIDVRSGESDGNWVRAEGNALEELLRELTDQELEPSDIRVISPFRDVVWETKKIGSRCLGYDFGKHHVGTIHTMQGRESEVVVLVLGSAPNNVRARAWAAEKPNLLNVAVSRAKRRLYVIGNRRNWVEQRHFDQLAASLPVR